MGTDSGVVRRNLGFLVSPLERSNHNCHPSHQTSTCTANRSQSTWDEDDPKSNYDSLAVYTVSLSQILDITHSSRMKNFKAFALTFFNGFGQLEFFFKLI